MSVEDLLRLALKAGDKDACRLLCCFSCGVGARFLASADRIQVLEAGCWKSKRTSIRSTVSCVIVTLAGQFSHVPRRFRGEKKQKRLGLVMGLGYMLSLVGQCRFTRLHPQGTATSPSTRLSVRYFRLPTDAPPPYVGSYPFRSSAGGTTPASRAVTRKQDAQQSFAASLALHFAAPGIADDDVTVAQGLHYPQRYIFPPRGGTLLVGRLIMH